VFHPRLHDAGEKRILGADGHFGADAALDVLLAQPEAATFVVTKLWREFVSPTPDAREVDRIANAFRASHYEIKVALRALLLSDAFWDPRNRGTLVKSPVELVVGALRTLPADAVATRAVVAATVRMGEVLFAPPNVRGWPGGDAWIDSATLAARQRFLARAMRTSMMPGMDQAGAGTLERLLLPLPPVGDAVSEAVAEREPAAVIRAAMLDPVYELK
jgi:uncharacterized protein (DUF1800 family)